MAAILYSASRERGKAPIYDLGPTTILTAISPLGAIQIVAISPLYLFK